VKSILEGKALKDGIYDNIIMNGNHWSARRRRRSFRPVGGCIGGCIDAERKRGSEARYRWNVYGQSMWLLLNFGRIRRQSRVFLFLPTVSSVVFDVTGRPVIGIADKDIKGITMIFFISKKYWTTKNSLYIASVLNRTCNRMCYDKPE